MRRTLACAAMCDIIFDVTWSLKLEPKVVQWMSELSVHDIASALPMSNGWPNEATCCGSQRRALGDERFVLRFDVLRVAWRITYFFATGRRIVLLTVFHKQR